jgi:hypothetical protein
MFYLSQNQCCGSLTFWCEPDQDLDPDPTFSNITSVFKDKKSKRSTKILGIKVFLTIFAWWQKDQDPYLRLEVPDPDPGGPKTHGSGGSGSATLLKIM